MEVSPAGALGPSLVALRHGLGPGTVGLASFHRAATGRMWVGVASVQSQDEDSLATLARALGAMRGLVDREPSPAALLSAVRDELVSGGDAACEVEAFIAALSDRSGELVCASAGRWSPWMLRAGAASPITLPSTPALGAAESPDDHVEQRVVMAPGDALCVAPADTSDADVASAFAARADGTSSPLVLALTHHGPVAEREAHTIELQLASELDAIERVTGLFDAFAAAHHVPDATRRTFDIAFDDLLNNIISYAYDGEPDHVIDVRVELSGGALVASFADDGPEFDPFAMDAPDTEADLDDRDIGGLGVHLVKSMMDDARYERRDARNVVIVTKHLEPLVSAQGVQG